MHGVPVYGSVADAVAGHEVDAAVVYVPPLAACDAVLESLEAGLKLVVALAEFVPRHDTALIAASARAAGATVVGCNTNGIISPGKSKLGAIGGDDPDQVFQPGRIGACSRYGGMSAELALALKGGGFGVSTRVSMSGDVMPGTRMIDYIAMFMADDDTDGAVIFGEPGTRSEHEVTDMLRDGAGTKPVVALPAGEFQENYPPGVSFGYVAAMINADSDSVSAKRKMLADAGALIARRLGDIPKLLRERHGDAC